MTQAVEYLHLPAGASLPAMSGTNPYKAVVVIEQVISPEWRDAVSAWLIASGCFYMMAWGRDCGEWDDSVDWASLEKNNFEIESDDDLVMTTWHDDEPLDDVFWFSRFCAMHPTIELERTLIIDIIADERRDDILDRFASAREQ